MSKWEFAIAVADEPEAHRKKEGDIIAVKPYPWQWGTREQDAYLIVIVNGLTQAEAHKYCSPMYTDGMTQDEVEQIATPINIDEIRQYENTHVDEPSQGEAIQPIYINGMTQAEVNQICRPIAKRRHSIPLDVLKSKMPELVLDKIKDKSLVYQPIKDKDSSIDLKLTKIIKDKFTGKLV